MAFASVQKKCTIEEQLDLGDFSGQGERHGYRPLAKELLDRGSCLRARPFYKPPPRVTEQVDLLPDDGRRPTIKPTSSVEDPTDVDDPSSSLNEVSPNGGIDPFPDLDMSDVEATVLKVRHRRESSGSQCGGGSDMGRQCSLSSQETTCSSSSSSPSSASGHIFARQESAGSSASRKETCSSIPGSVSGHNFARQESASSSASRKDSVLGQFSRLSRQISDNWHRLVSEGSDISDFGMEDLLK